MKVKVSEATPLQLNWMVAKADGKADDVEYQSGNLWYGRTTSGFVVYSPVVNWSQGGPIIQQEGISIVQEGDAADWVASLYDYHLEDWVRHTLGPTPLTAAMHCYVASKLGDEVEIPEELQ